MAPSGATPRRSQDTAVARTTVAAREWRPTGPRSAHGHGRSPWLCSEPPPIAHNTCAHGTRTSAPPAWPVDRRGRGPRNNAAGGADVRPIPSFASPAKCRASPPHAWSQTPPLHRPSSHADGLRHKTRSAFTRVRGGVPAPSLSREKRMPVPAISAAPPCRRGEGGAYNLTTPLGSLLCQPSARA